MITIRGHIKTLEGLIKSDADPNDTRCDILGSNEHESLLYALEIMEAMESIATAVNGISS